MTGKSYYIINALLISLVLLLVLPTSLYSQDVEIGGVINVYKSVEAIGPGTDNVTLNDVNSILPGDTVLLIQMQGVGIVTSNDQGYGQAVQSLIGSPGDYEFLLVQSVDPGTRKVIFKNNILNDFDVRGNVQLVKVPYYNTATVTSTITAPAWDSLNKTGGVVAMIVGRKLTLNADIDVSGKGFAGGQDIVGDGICVMTNSSLYGNFFYPESWQNSGYKGEGVAIHDRDTNLLSPLHVKGIGINFTGGGGGNGQYAGGGGGSNRGKGGDGGAEKSFGAGTCTLLSPDVAYGGTTIRSSVITDGIFLGGGGGASTHADGSSGSSGGNGGGIVIIIADTISGNKLSIKAEGQTAGDAMSDGGAGGGGAGGSVVMSLQSFSDISSDSLTISVKGGDGGINPIEFGADGYGGGGGGGLLWVSTSSVPGKVPVEVDYGTPGPTNLNEGLGEIKNNFNPTLNGFLFNSISSEVTGNQVDSICSDVPFGQINGTMPVGGTPPYTYLWEMSTTSESAGFSPATGVNDGQNYSPGLLTQTTWFRRTVSDNSIPVLIDISKPVQVIVQLAITGNDVGKDTTICYNQDPLSLVPLNSGPSNGNGIYQYKWVQNFEDINWDVAPDAVGTKSNDNYDPPSLINTTYYKRIVTSGRCVNFSPTVTIDVLPLITGNITMRPDSVICEGELFNVLGASTTGGGDLTYSYLWQDSISSGVWQDALGINDVSSYAPDTSAFSSIGERFFRRVVFSGPDSVCRSNSSPIKLTRYFKVENNSISSDQTICSGSSPIDLSGSSPTFGSGFYAYLWQDSSKSGNWTTRGSTDFSFSPGALTDTTWYRRIVNSSKCSDTSNIIAVDVHKPITSNNVSLLTGGLTDTTLCSGALPNSLLGTTATGGTDILGDYVYQWLFSVDNAVWQTVTTSGTDINYSPPSLTTTTYYKRQVTSGTCIDTSSNTVTINILPLITDNIISSDQTVCFNTVPAQLTGIQLSGGAGAGSYSFFWEESSDGAIWNPASGVNNLPSGDYLPQALTVPVQYRRIVTSGENDCCTSISNIVDIGIHPLPTGTIVSISDTTVCEGSAVPLKITLTGSPNWDIIVNENSSPITFSNIDKPDTTLMLYPAITSSSSSLSYLLSSVVDNNGCEAISLSGLRSALVYKVPVANAGTDNVVCGPEVTLQAVPSYGTGTWYYPPEVLTSIGSGSSVIVTVDSLFADGNITHKFVWEEINWQCTSKDSVFITFDKRISSINAGPDTTLYSFDNVMYMVADPLLSWETGLWTVVAGTGDFEDNSNNNTAVRNLSSEQLNIFLWTVTNGDCISEDSVNIKINNLIIPEGFSPNNDPGGFNNTFIITGLDLPNQEAELRVVNGAGTEVFSTSNLNGEEWIDWDGKNSKGIDLPEGTYYYLLKITSKSNGQVFKKSGFIILKRY